MVNILEECCDVDSFVFSLGGVRHKWLLMVKTGRACSLLSEVLARQ